MSSSNIPSRQRDNSISSLTTLADDDAFLVHLDQALGVDDLEAAVLLDIMNFRRFYGRSSSEYGSIIQSPELHDEHESARLAVDLADIRRHCPRFRVLIMGRANSGKTTILRKVCNSMTEVPIVRDKDMNKLDAQQWETPDSGRGVHDIENEVTFDSNPGFVFHDCCGFESGDTAELEQVRTFIRERSKESSLKKQLHAIWFCLPMDTDRPLCEAEMSFFNEGTGQVPVIAVFSKFDGIDMKMFGELRERGVPRSEAKEKAQEAADAVFKSNHLVRVQNTAHPPAAYVCFRNMHQDTASSNPLIEKTAEALQSDSLRLLFASVQVNNIGLRVQVAIDSIILPRYYLKRHIKSSLSSKEKKSLVSNILGAFPHIWKDCDYHEKHESTDDYTHAAYYANNFLESDYNAVFAAYYAYHSADPLAARRHYEKAKKAASHFNDCYVVLEPMLESLAAGTSSDIQILHLGLSTLIIAEHSFWYSRQTVAEGVRVALDVFTASLVPDAVARVAEEVQQLKGRKEKKTAISKQMSKILVEFVSNNLLPHGSPLLPK